MTQSQLAINAINFLAHIGFKVVSQPLEETSYSIKFKITAGANKARKLLDSAIDPQTKKQLLDPGHSDYDIKTDTTTGEWYAFSGNLWSRGVFFEKVGKEATITLVDEDFEKLEVKPKRRVNAFDVIRKMYPAQLGYTSTIKPGYYTTAPRGCRSTVFHFRNTSNIADVALEEMLEALTAKGLVLTLVKEQSYDGICQYTLENDSKYRSLTTLRNRMGNVILWFNNK